MINPLSTLIRDHRGSHNRYRIDGKRMSKSGAFSMQAIEFILNVVAVVIVIVAIATIIRMGTANAVYTENQHFKIELDYVLFSKAGLMPDRYRLVQGSIAETLGSLKIDDLAMRFTIGGNTYYLNEDLFNNYYALRKFKGYFYDKIEKPVLLVSDASGKPDILTIEYVFKGEELPKAVRVNT